MKHHHLLIAAACATGITAPAFAETSAAPLGLDGEAELIDAAATFAEDTGSAERIESAEMLRTYTQEVAAAACFLYNDIDQTLSSKLMTEARAGFDKHIDALLNGNEELGIIGGEERRKTIVQLEDIRTAWGPIATATDTLLSKHDDDAAVSVIKSGNMPLFEMTNKLVSEMEGQYSDPAVLMQSDVLTLEIVGRQATMTQMIAKNACKIFSGNQSEDVRAELKQSMELYEVSLNALINGMPEVGIAPAPTEEIETALNGVLSDWQKMRPTFDTLLETGAMERDTQVEIFQHMASEMYELEDITHKYTIFSKH
ncbi:type IV pili methyl-accepting chemotaxis transducer N-terminal domain-containing protein [Marivita hallyeonensis]|uniref:Type IV pili methyl-accepting chemotaxis transducer N-term n=1 Tax=Marivita hallyeonensis TaxID=996342 RepID=A0A1M5LRS1_9RHOB|nr:type IV pili methyl-accepting chemotaxis transducer N-terminal domain-containing protein [Marivita hallyeonensis]SHG67590.1 Type IV pili methyl-accepting chemotaxis transducer N-term [Marivita hallyeonensis]